MRVGASHGERNEDADKTLEAGSGPATMPRQCRDTISGDSRLSYQDIL